MIIDTETHQVIKPAPHRIDGLSMEFPSGLRSLEDAARDLGIGVERLRDLAAGGYAPHFRIDGGPPFFKITELKRWAGANLVQRIEGRDLPAPVKVIAPAQRVSDFRKVPTSLREVTGLCDITDELFRTGIYFLCRDNALLYVGQSINVAGRVLDHYRRFEFDTILYLPWPGDDLDRIEAALIRALRPPLNGKTQNGHMRTSASPNADAEAELIAKITNAAAHGSEAPTP